jgi:hypothetical protein
LPSNNKSIIIMYAGKWDKKAKDDKLKKQKETARAEIEKNTLIVVPP